MKGRTPPPFFSTRCRAPPPGATTVSYTHLDVYKRQEEDYKTKLQEIVQQNPEERLRYVVTDESGPDHNKHFVVEVRCV